MDFRASPPRTDANPVEEERLMSAHDSNLRAAALLASHPFAKNAKGWAPSF